MKTLKDFVIDCGLESDIDREYVSKALKDFGEQCFEAARKINILALKEGIDENLFYTYEDYLKALEEKP